MADSSIICVRVFESKTAARMCPKRRFSNSSPTAIELVFSVSKILLTQVNILTCSILIMKSHYCVIIVANDIGKGSYGALKVKSAFEYAYLTLSEAVAPQHAYLIKDNQSILGRIIRITQEVIEYRRWIKELYASQAHHLRFDASMFAGGIPPAPSLMSSQFSNASSFNNTTIPPFNNNSSNPTTVSSSTTTVNSPTTINSVNNSTSNNNNNNNSTTSYVPGAGVLLPPQPFIPNANASYPTSLNGTPAAGVLPPPGATLFPTAAFMPFVSAFPSQYAPLQKVLANNANNNNAPLSNITNKQPTGSQQNGQSNNNNSQQAFPAMPFFYQMNKSSQGNIIDPITFYSNISAANPMVLMMMNAGGGPMVDPNGVNPQTASQTGSSRFLLKEK